MRSAQTKLCWYVALAQSTTELFSPLQVFVTVMLLEMSSHVEQMPALV